MCCAFNKTRGMNIKMREVEQKNYTFSNDDYLSVFVGVCKSQELLDKYLKKNYELIEDGFIGSEFGVDFNINTYDEDFKYGCCGWFEKPSGKDAGSSAIQRVDK